MATRTLPSTASSRAYRPSSATRIHRRTASWPAVISISRTAMVMEATRTGRHGYRSVFERMAGYWAGAPGSEWSGSKDGGYGSTHGLSQRSHVLPSRDEPGNGKQQSAGLCLRLSRLPRGHHGAGHELCCTVGLKRPLPPANQDRGRSTPPPLTPKTLSWHSHLPNRILLATEHQAGQSQEPWC